MQFFPNLLAKAGGNSFTRTLLPLDAPVGRHLSLVVAAIPANAAFPLHMHPKSEDAFVVISGSGHRVGEARPTHSETLRRAVTLAHAMPEKRATMMVCRRCARTA